MVPHKIIEKYGNDWTRTENIVTCGAFKLAVHRPYDILTVVRDPNYWDAANVKLDGIEFYPLDEQTTMMNLYKAGSVDALYNHTVPAAWFDTIKQYTAEYSLQPEVADEFYVMNVKKPPMDKLKVRQSFALAIDRESLAQFRKTLKPLVDMTPQGVFPKYEEAREKVYTEELKKQGSSLAEWKARIFDAEKARKLMTEAGYAVNKSGDGYSCPSFPVDQVSITYNTAESNKSVAEFVQAQWKQNLGITVVLRNMESKTFLAAREKLDYKGFALGLWGADYMDPFTFLNYFSTAGGSNGTGWADPQYLAMLAEANRTLDKQKRYELLARAEKFLLDAQPFIPIETFSVRWVKKPYVKGMYPNPGSMFAWKFVYIERDPSKWDTD